LFPPARENYLLSVVSKYYVPYQSDGGIGLSAAKLGKTTSHQIIVSKNLPKH